LKNKITDVFKSYDPQKYHQGITVAKLIAVTLHQMNEAKISTSFENVVISAHTLFPEKFSMLNFPEHPDTMRIDNTLRLDAKKHGQFLKGNRVKGYLLTGLGRQAAQTAIEELQSKSQKLKKKVNRKGWKIESKLVYAVTKSDAYEKFSTKQFSDINKFEICDVLHGTLQTPINELERNLSTLIGHCIALEKITEYQEVSKNALTFLKYLEEDFEELIK
jgi:hypothetical protein